MKRLVKITPVVFLLFGILFRATAQETDGETFIQNLIRNLARANWEASETGALERHLLTYEWKNLTGVDPEIVAQALSYGRERGILAPEDLAEIARELSLNMREMSRLGLQPRDMVRAAMNAVRMVTTERTVREGAQIPDLAEAFREQIRRQIAGAQQSSLRRQAQRRSAGPDKLDTWSPPTPEERASGGSSNVPSGPGKPSGPASEISDGNGGR
ncbi:MAG: hypothetical protein JW852_01945 [Spirochaetales bacterium]|nr:hypothetical protein [Spirochaetales bacterium]